MKRDKSGWFVLVFGVILPLVMLALELSTRVFTELLFNPFPTTWHIVLFAGIAVGNGLALWGLGRPSNRLRGRLLALNGLTIGITIWYMLQFLPITLLAVPAFLFVFLFPPLFVIGICGISPMLAFIAAIVCRNHLAAGGKAGMSRSGFWLGLGFAALLMLMLEVPGALTESYLQKAASGDTATSRQAISMLRRWGNRRVMLLRCYERPRTGTGMLSLLMSGTDNVAPQDAREIYYRVTGQPFNDVPAPVNQVSQRDGFSRRLNWDAGQGGDEVAGKVDGLSMKSSRIDGSVDADAALGYLEWTVLFTNESTVPGEARMQVALPPGSSVSRLTLWVDGEEREAAFAARGRVREVYREVAIVRRRDPVLVTTCGSDRILVQCFPVPANGGEMKVRLGITSPLVMDELSSGILALPRIVEQNFDTADSLKHLVWLEAKGPVSSRLPGLREERIATGYALSGEVLERQYTRQPAVLSCRRDPGAMLAWTPDNFGSRHSIILQTIAQVKGTAPGRVVLVVDGSAGMRGSIPAIAGALTAFPRDGKFAVLVAGDSVYELIPPRAATLDARAHAARQLRQYRCIGGTDNVPALAKAWDLASAEPGGAILWIHGPQPLLLASVSELQQRWERRPDGPRLYALEAVAGDNAPLRELDRLYAVRNVARLGTLDTDIRRILLSWNEQRHPVAVRKRISAADWRNRAGSKEKTSKHLARLWARDQAMAFYAQHDPKQTEMAIATAMRYQIVTPVTGAVVLETQQQYQDAGLEPVSAGTVPTIPEPEFWLLLAVAFAMLAYLWWKKRTAWAR